MEGGKIVLYFVALVLEHTITGIIRRIGDTITEKQRIEIVSRMNDKCTKELFWEYEGENYKVKESYIIKMDRWVV